MSTMTPATAALKKAGISYKLYEYDADGQHHDFGHHAAEELGRDQAEVCKTLLIHHEKSSVTTVVPVNCKLNLKRAAKIAGLKNAEMMEPAAAYQYSERGYEFRGSKTGDAGKCGSV